MSEKTEYDVFLAELQEMLAKDAPAGKKVGAAPELAEAKPVAEQPSQAAVAPAAQAAAPFSQPVASSIPSPEPMPTAAKARAVDHEPVKLEGSDALDGVLVFSEGDEPAQKDVVRVPGKQKTAAAVKMKLVTSVMVLLAAGYLMIPSDLVPQEVAQAAQAPASAPVVAGEQSELAQETALQGDASQAAAAAHAGEPVSVGIDLSAMDESPQNQDDLVAEMARDLQVIPEAEQSCAAGALSNSERRVCSTTGHVRFFACTRGTGRIWDVRVAGCEVI